MSDYRYQQYPANTDGLPVANINVDNVTVTVNEMLKDSRAENTDRTTYEEMRIELAAISDRIQQNTVAVERLETELADLEKKYSRKKEAIRVSKELVGKRPGLRNDIAELERQLEGLEEDGQLTKKALLQHRAMLAGADKLFKEFDHKKLARLLEEEQTLAKAGL